jgi:NADH dehydrogenase
MENLPHVVIIGGGFGGLQATRELKNAAVRITLIDKSNHHLFQPLLYQVATAGLSPADIAAPIRGILRKQQNVDVILAEVTGVDSKNKKVMIPDRSIDYDYLVIATGAVYGYFGHEDWEKYAPGLKSIVDATLIRQKILLAFEAAESELDPAKRKELLTFVIVGGGPTGVELAGALYELTHIALASDFRHIDPKSTRILLVEAGQRILASFSEPVAMKAQRKLESFGVEIRTGKRVEEITGDGVVVSGEKVAAKNVFWAAGVVASPAAKWLGLESDRAGRVKVLSNLTAPGHADVFVIGDTATLDQDGQSLPGVAPVALQQGSYVARVLAKRIRGEAEEAPFHYRDKGNLATVGRAFAVVEYKKFRSAGWVAWVLWLLVHIYYLIGFRNRLIVVLEWTWAYLTFQRGARLITRSIRHENVAISAD